MSKLLSSRIAALEGPCREIDREIESFMEVSKGALFWCSEQNKAFFNAADGYMHEYEFKPQPLTSSLDAITQLIEKDLPGSTWEVTQDSVAEIFVSAGSGLIDITEIQHYNPAIALCLAYCLAMEANNETDS